MGALKDTIPENKDHLLAGAWWVTLKSLDLYNIFLNDGVVMYSYDSSCSKH